jgi:hypothetical protein
LDIKYNFISIVVIGNFNPAILTFEFLTEVCKINLKKGQYLTPLQLPFPRELFFPDDKLNFLIDLDRLQIKETNMLKADDCKGPEIINKYLTKLPYTPIRATGLNFNSSIDMKSNEGKSLDTLIRKNEKDLLKIFNVDNINLKTNKIIENTAEFKTNEWEISFIIQDFKKSSINIKALDNRFILNHNIEVTASRGMTDSYKEITDNDKFISNLKIHTNTINRILNG